MSFCLDEGHYQPLRAHTETWEPLVTLLSFSHPQYYWEFTLLSTFAWTDEIFLWHIPIS